jgi:hypothetical protein
MHAGDFLEMLDKAKGTDAAQWLRETLMEEYSKEFGLNEAEVVELAQRTEGMFFELEIKVHEIEEEKDPSAA